MSHRTALFANTHWLAVLQGLLVAFLWSTSWVLIKWGLVAIPALTFAGLRYTLAWLCLLPIFFHRGGLATLRRQPARVWGLLAALGVLLYALAQGAQFIGLAYLPAITLNLLLAFSPVAVAFAGMVFLGERPTGWQWLGVAISTAGIVLYFYPATIPAGQAAGLIAALVCIFANAGAALLGRQMNREATLSPLVITTASMGVGALLMLAGGLAWQGLPALDWRSWAIIAWLAVVNTAFAFTLWNVTLRVLSAFESSIINNTMAVQIPLLAVLILGERLNGQQWLGLGVALAGMFAVQWGRRRKSLRVFVEEEVTSVEANRRDVITLRVYVAMDATPAKTRSS